MVLKCLHQRNLYMKSKKYKFYKKDIYILSLMVK